MDYKVGDSTNLGTDAHHLERKEMPLMRSGGPLIGRHAPNYFRMHEGVEGSDPQFPPGAEHIAVITAIDDGCVHRRCSCGARWKVPPEAPVIPPA